jgi:type I restriction enzyme M protein
MAQEKKSEISSNGGNLGFEEKLWQTADKLRGHMDPSEYKHVVLGLIFLKHISDIFEEHYNRLSRVPISNPEDRKVYDSANIFWVPKRARWGGPNGLQARVSQPKTNIGKLLDQAMSDIEKENPSLNGFLPNFFARQSLDSNRLSEIVALVGTIGLGSQPHKSMDLLGRVYEIFLGRFARAEGNSGGQFYTPQCVVKLLVEMIEPFKGIVFDPCCGSGGMFVQSEEFVLAHGGRSGDIKIFGQESNITTCRLAKMNLALRGIDADIRWNNQGSFHNDAFPELKADFIIANPPFNDSDWGGIRLQKDPRWKYGTPQPGNANLAWVQHFLHHLGPNGTAGFVLSNGSLSSNQYVESSIRKAIIEADLVDCIVYLPTQLFYNTQISASLWFLTKNKKDRGRNRTRETLFIYAYDMGRMKDRTHRELTDSEIQSISSTYRAWRSDPRRGKYVDVPGFCKSVSLSEISRHKMTLVPGRYVGFDRTISCPPSLSDLQEELEQIRDRFSVSKTASERAMSILEELLHA